MIPLVIATMVVQLIMGFAVVLLRDEQDKMEKRVTQLEDAVTKPTPPPPRRAGFQ